MQADPVEKYYPLFQFFQKLTTKEQQQISRYLHILETPARHSPYVQGAIAISCYFVLQGSIELVREKENGPADRLYLVTAGHFCGHAMFLENDARHAETATACEPCVLAALVRKDFQLLQKHHPALAMKIVQFIQLELYQAWIQAREEYYALSDRLTKAQILI
jgi:CRP-like cAMP-binding protein